MEISVGSGISIGNPTVLQCTNCPSPPPPNSFPKILEIEISWNKNKSVHGPVLLALVCTSVKSPNADQTLLFLTYFWPMNHCWLTIHKFTFYFLRRLYQGKLASTLLYMIDRFVPEAKDSSKNTVLFHLVFSVAYERNKRQNKSNF